MMACLLQAAIFTSSWGQPKAKSRIDERLLAQIVLTYGQQKMALNQSSSTQVNGDTVLYRYRVALPPILDVSLNIVPVHGADGEGEMLQARISCDQPLQQDLAVRVPLSWAASSTITLPMKNGLLKDMTAKESATYRFAGMDSAAGKLLSIPVVWSAQADGRKHALFTDPYYSTMFTPAGIEWSYPAKVGLENGAETRLIASLAVAGGADDVLGCFFKLAMADVPAGPPWLRDIAMVDYDYMSDGGQGWYRDIDALVPVIQERDRKKVVLCLHGWYDWVGRYCYDLETDQLAETWTAFGNYPNVSVKFANSKPVSMSLVDMHRRIHYARSRGFRVALYFADGVLSGDQLEERAPAPDLVLFTGGWQGPDTKGKSFCQNPLADRVQRFYLNYAAALLREYGHEIDALVWDETFYVENGSLGTPGLRGYADRAMMQLVKKITRSVHCYNDKHKTAVAFLTADCIGQHNYAKKALYALVADGTYHDTGCEPASWSFGIFPNYRNVLWSCNWYPVTRYRYTEFGVRHYQAPVAVSNGYGNDIGFSEMNPEQRQQIIDLFEWRKSFTTRLHGLEKLAEYK